MLKMIKPYIARQAQNLAHGHPSVAYGIADIDMCRRRRRHQVPVEYEPVGRMVERAEIYQQPGHAVGQCDPCSLLRLRYVSRDIHKTLLGVEMPHPYLHHLLWSDQQVVAHIAREKHLPVVVLEVVKDHLPPVLVDIDTLKVILASLRLMANGRNSHTACRIFFQIASLHTPSPEARHPPLVIMERSLSSLALFHTPHQPSLHCILVQLVDIGNPLIISFQLVEVHRLLVHQTLRLARHLLLALLLVRHFFALYPIFQDTYITRVRESARVTQLSTILQLAQVQTIAHKDLAPRRSTLWIGEDHLVMLRGPPVHKHHVNHLQFVRRILTLCLHGRQSLDCTIEILATTAHLASPVAVGKLDIPFLICAEHSRNICIYVRVRKQHFFSSLILHNFLKLQNQGSR